MGTPDHLSRWNSVWENAVSNFSARRQHYVHRSNARTYGTGLGSPSKLTFVLIQ